MTGSVRLVAGLARGGGAVEGFTVAICLLSSNQDSTAGREVFVLSTNQDVSAGRVVTLYG